MTKTSSARWRSLLKQSNKPKKSRYASKSTLTLRIKNLQKLKRAGGKLGGVTRPSSSAKSVAAEAARRRKSDRRHQARQAREVHRNGILSCARFFEGIGKPPKVVTLVPLCVDVELDAVVRMLQGEGDEMQLDAAEEAMVIEQQEKQVEQEGFWVGKTRIRLLRACFLDSENSTSVLNAIKLVTASDAVILVLSAKEEVTLSTETALDTLIASGVPLENTYAVVQHLDSEANLAKVGSIKRSLQSYVKDFIPAVSTITNLAKEDELKRLRMSLGSAAVYGVDFVQDRAYLVSDGVSWTQDGTLVISGYSRGRCPFSLSTLVHIADVGDFELDKIVVPRLKLTQTRSEMSEEYFDDAKSQSEFMDETESSEPEDIGDRDESVPEQPEDEGTVQVLVPKGTSEYQATWLHLAGDLSYSETEETEIITLKSCNQNKKTKDSDSESEGDGNPETLQARLRARQEQQHFPDEVFLQPDEKARVKLRKYRGLRSFRHASWDPNEALPKDYRKIYRISNYVRTQKVVRENAEDGNRAVIPGDFVQLHVKGVSEEDLNASQGPTVVYGLWQLEHRKSVMNFTLKRQPRPVRKDRTPLPEVVVKSDDRVLLQVGPRRFWTRPIFSEYTNISPHSRTFAGSAAVTSDLGTELGTLSATSCGPSRGVKVAKYEPYLQDGVQLCGSAYARITFSRPRAPAPVLMWQELDGRLQFVGSGSLINMDPDRVVLKRVVLTAEIFKVHSRKVTLRYMFFNAADVKWFKPVPLFTKSGKTGQIIKSLGEKGRMKATFSGKPIQQDDIVCMALYRRIFPKWTSYEDYNCRQTLRGSEGDQHDDTVMDEVTVMA